MLRCYECLSWKDANLESNVGKVILKFSMIKKLFVNLKDENAIVCSLHFCKIISNFFDYLKNKMVICKNMPISLQQKN